MPIPKLPHCRTAATKPCSTFVLQRCEGILNTSLTGSSAVWLIIPGFTTRNEALQIQIKKVRTVSVATSLSNSEFMRLATEEQIAKTVRALEAHSIRVVIFETSEEARKYVLDLIPSGSDVYNSSSRTLELIGLADDIEHPTRFQSVRTQLYSLDRVTQRAEMRKVGASPDVLVGSVHAITEQGEIMLASATGSQLGPAAFGAGIVIWVVGTQKLVHTLEDGLRRIREYSLPLESERAQQVYGQASSINKLLIVNGEAYPGRITVVLVKQQLGF